MKFHNYHHVNLRLMVKKLTKHIFAPKLHTRPPWCHREFYACKIALWKKMIKKIFKGGGGGGETFERETNMTSYLYSWKCNIQTSSKWCHGIHATPISCIHKCPKKVLFNNRSGVWEQGGQRGSCSTNISEL